MKLQFPSLGNLDLAEASCLGCRPFLGTAKLTFGGAVRTREVALVLLGVYLRGMMGVQTRKLDTTYRILSELTIGRSEWVRGDFDAYDSDYNTLKTEWWIESDGKRRNSLISEIDLLLIGRLPLDAVSLATYYADAHDLGSVLCHNYFGVLDFSMSFGRSESEMFPKIVNGQLHFVTRKTFGEHIATESEFWDNLLEIASGSIRSSCFWTGDHSRQHYIDRV